MIQSGQGARLAVHRVAAADAMAIDANGQPVAPLFALLHGGGGGLPVDRREGKRCDERSQSQGAAAAAAECEAAAQGVKGFISKKGWDFFTLLVHIRLS